MAKTEPAQRGGPSKPEASPRRAEAAPAETGSATSSIRVAHHIEQVQKVAQQLRLPQRHLWWQSWSWLVLLAMAVAAYVLAVAFGPGGWTHRLLDGLRLFPSGFPGYQRHRGWEYVLALHLAALVSLIVTLRIVTALLADRFAQLRARLRRGHVVICGLSQTGLRSTLAFRAGGYRVTCLDLDGANDAGIEARNAGALVLRRDATQLSALGYARADRAAFVVCAGPDDATNTKIAFQVVSLAHVRGSAVGPNVHVEIEDPDLARLLRSPLAAVGLSRLHFFDLASVWARAMLDRRESPLSAPGGKPSTIAVLGSTALADAVVVEAARRWHEFVRRAGVESRLKILAMGPVADEQCARLATRYPALPRVCDLVPLAQAVRPGSVLEVDELRDAPAGCAVFACLEDQSDNLAVAIELTHLLGDKVAVVLPATEAAGALGPLLAGRGRICPTFLATDSGSLDLLHDNMRETLAREVHKTYLEERRSAAEFGQRPAEREWEQLAPADREANRLHVDGIVEQLNSVWYEIEPLYDWDEPMGELSRSSVDSLAELEHLRWCREKEAAGWERGEVRDNARKRHDLLVPWSELSPEAREIDKVLVKARPALLKRAGYKLVRNPARERIARSLHERYLAGSDGAQSSEAMRPWEELDEELRERNRSAVDDIAVKLARIRCRAVPAAVGAALATKLTSSELERLAELEHERWVAEREDDGWSKGPRDDARKLHPQLVDWNELPEEEREKDREVVRAIPELLASAHYSIARERC